MADSVPDPEVGSPPVGRGQPVEGGRASAGSEARRGSPGSRGVLYIVASLKSGGTETQLVELCRRLDRDRYQPFVLCFRRRGGLLGEIERLGVEVRETGHDPPFSARGLLEVGQHATWARRRGIALIHGFHFQGNLYGALLRRRCRGSRLVVCEHGLTGPNRLRHKLARRFYYGSADAILGNCEAVRRSMVERDGLTPGRIRVIPGGVAAERFAMPAPDPPGGADSEGPVIGCVGRLHPDKGQDILLEAAPAILDALPNARILLAGEGPMRADLESAIESTGLAGKVILLGDRRDIPRLLAGIHLLILPSRTEGFANAALEGLAAGLPVAASDAGGNSEVIRDGVTGRLFAAGDPSALARCVLQILGSGDRGRHLGAAGRLAVESSFGVEVMVRRHERMYDELIGASSPPGRKDLLST